MTPTRPGRYWAREISLDMLGLNLVTMPFMVDVVSGVPNERGDPLVVATRSQNPRYKTLNCYKWGDPSPAEIRMIESFMWNLTASQST